ncbi:hypothetical protein DXG01_017027 [Tephrocybe rancida]|nr:hypothetical protein DXG01_017027 [Tephrocybe rancida]
MEDLSYGGRATGLLELILAIRAQKKNFRKIDTLAISETLNTFCVGFEPMLVSGGSEILFISALFEILRWERDATTERPNPIAHNDIDHLLWRLGPSDELHYKSSVALAERLLGDLQSSLEATKASGRNQTGEEHNLDIGSPMGDQSSLTQDPEDYGARTLLLFNAINTQRKLWQDKRADPSREAGQSSLPTVRLQ